MAHEKTIAPHVSWRVGHVFNQASTRRAIGTRYDSLEHVIGLNDARNEWRTRP